MQCALLYTAHILANVDDLNFQWTWTFRYAYCFLLKLVASMRFETDAVVLWEIQNPAVLIQTLIWLISGCTETQLLFWQFFSQHWVVHSVLSLTKKTQTAFSSPWVWSEISASLRQGRITRTAGGRSMADGWGRWPLTAQMWEPQENKLQGDSHVTISRWASCEAWWDSTRPFVSGGEMD